MYILLYKSMCSNCDMYDIRCSTASAAERPVMKGRNRFTIGALGLVLGCYAISVLWKRTNGTQYRSLPA